jgi:hypothetical protein
MEFEFVQLQRFENLDGEFIAVVSPLVFCPFSF